MPAPAGVHRNNGSYCLWHETHGVTTVNRSLAKICIIATTIFFSTVASANILNFDDLPGSHGSVGLSYKGLYWDNFYYMAPKADGFWNTGYGRGLLSKNNVAYNGYGWPANIFTFASDGFTLGSGYFTAAWEDEMVTVNGIGTDGSLTSVSFVANTKTPVFETFNWQHMFSVTFLTSTSEQFALDNLSLGLNEPNPRPAALPDAKSWATMLMGLGIVGGIIRRRRRLAAFV